MNRRRIARPQKRRDNTTLLVCLRIVRAALAGALILCLLGYAIGRAKVRELPSEGTIVPDLMRDPIQAMTNQSPFQFEYRGSHYHVDPQATYDISGLVVSHNDITAWWDIYHDENSVDIKDLCLIWGGNAEEKVYRNTRFWNESVSCHVQTLASPAHELFYGPELSNNHLISSDPDIQAKIREVRVGDQIRMQGYLVNYNDTMTPEFVRKSSLTRKDTAGFACEVMYVSHLDFLRKGPRTWHHIYESARRWLLKLCGVTFLMFLLFPWLEFRLT